MENIKKLRARTGAGILDCQKALKETDGDMEAAVDFLRKKGLAKAAKKGDREAKEGAVVVATSEDRKQFAMLQLNCETDFVSRNQDFQTEAHKLVTVALENQSKSVEDFNTTSIEGVTSVEYVQGLIAKFGENTVVGRVISGSTDGFFNNYIHMKGKIGVVVECKGNLDDDNLLLSKDVAMHAAAMAPSFLDKSDVDSSNIEREKEIYKAEMADSGKPEQVVERIIEGKLGKYYEASCLLCQKFFKDTSVTIADHIKGKIDIVAFHRFVLGGE